MRVRTIMHSSTKAEPQQKAYFLGFYISGVTWLPIRATGALLHAPVPATGFTQQKSQSHRGASPCPCACHQFYTRALLRPLCLPSVLHNKRAEATRTLLHAPVPTTNFGQNRAELLCSDYHLNRGWGHSHYGFTRHSTRGIVLTSRLR